MHILNVPKTNIILTLLKTCCCNKSIDNVVETQWKICYSDKNEMFRHIIQTYHKKPYPNIVKVMILKGTWNNVVVNRYKEAG